MAVLALIVIIASSGGGDDPAGGTSTSAQQNTRPPPTSRRRRAPRPSPRRRPRRPRRRPPRRSPPAAASMRRSPSTTRASRCCQSGDAEGALEPLSQSVATVPGGQHRHQLRLRALQLRPGPAAHRQPRRGDPAAREASRDLRLQGREVEAELADGREGSRRAERRLTARRSPRPAPVRRFGWRCRDAGRPPAAGPEARRPSAACRRRTGSACGGRSRRRSGRSRSGSSIVSTRTTREPAGIASATTRRICSAALVVVVVKDVLEHVDVALGVDPLEHVRPRAARRGRRRRPRSRWPSASGRPPAASTRMPRQVRPRAEDRGQDRPGPAGDVADDPALRPRVAGDDPGERQLAELAHRVGERPLLLRIRREVVPGGGAVNRREARLARADAVGQRGPGRAARRRCSGSGPRGRSTGSGSSPAPRRRAVSAKRLAVELDHAEGGGQPQHPVERVGVELELGRELRGGPRSRRRARRSRRARRALPAPASGRTRSPARRRGPPGGRGDRRLAGGPGGASTPPGPRAAEGRRRV